MMKVVRTVRKNYCIGFNTIILTNYGVMGMGGFRYSNFWIAQTITTQGKLTLKIAQYLTENYLKYLAEQNKQ